MEWLASVGRVLWNCEAAFLDEQFSVLWSKGPEASSIQYMQKIPLKRRVGALTLNRATILWLRSILSSGLLAFGTSLLST